MQTLHSQPLRLPPSFFPPSFLTSLSSTSMLFQTELLEIANPHLHGSYIVVEATDKETKHKEYVFMALNSGKQSRTGQWRKQGIV